MLRMLQLIEEEVMDVRSRWKGRTTTIKVGLDGHSGAAFKAGAETLSRLAPDLTKEQAMRALACALIRNGIYERTRAGEDRV